MTFKTGKKKSKGGKYRHTKRVMQQRGGEGLFGFIGRKWEDRKKEGSSYTWREFNTAIADTYGAINVENPIKFTQLEKPTLKNQIFISIFGDAKWSNWFVPLVGNNKKPAIQKDILNKIRYPKNIDQLMPKPATHVIRSITADDGLKEWSSDQNFELGKDLRLFLLYVQKIPIDTEDVPDKVTMSKETKVQIHDGGEGYAFHYVECYVNMDAPPKTSKKKPPVDTWAASLSNTSSDPGAAIEMVANKDSNTDGGSKKRRKRPNKKKRKQTRKK
jgi:hypothetical protein